MNHTFFSDVVFETKQMQKQKCFSRKNSSDMCPNNIYVNMVKNSCLLGSLEIKQKQKSNQITKFQIVQLKKSRQKPITQKTFANTLLQFQQKNKQLNNYRNSFKVKKLERTQIGMIQNNFAVPLIENSEIQISAGNVQIRKATFTCRNPSANIENFKFIPNLTFCPQKSQQLFYNKKQGFFTSERQFRKKNIGLNFYPETFSLSEMKSLQGNNDNDQKNKKGPQNYSQKSDVQTLTTKDSPIKSKPKNFFNQQKQHRERLQIEKKIYMQIRKEVNKNYGKPFNPPQKISAQAYIVYEITKKKFKYRKIIETKKDKKKFSNSHKVLAEYNSRSPCQIASLTKIMTFLVALSISQKYSLDPSQQLIQIGNFEHKINGTSANLQSGEIYTLEQLFYGLMLPSGNDASIAIAVWGGQALMKKSQAFSPNESLFKKKKAFYDRFLDEMNKKAVELGMQKTHFANSHGLPHFENKSCAFDLALLCEEALKNTKFKQVVQTCKYECTVKSEKQNLSTINSPTFQKCQKDLNSISGDDMKDQFESQNSSIESENQEVAESQKIMKQNQSNAQLQKASNYQSQKTYDKKVLWQNTHLLLQQKPGLYKGIKTGVTNAAGPCLASFVEYNERQFIFIVLNCKTMKQRFRDTQNLRKWTFQKQQLKLQNN